MKRIIIIFFAVQALSSHAQTYNEVNRDVWINLVDFMVNNGYASVSYGTISQYGCTILRKEIRRLNNLGYYHQKAASYVQARLSDNDAGYTTCKMAYPNNFHLMCTSYVSLGARYTTQSSKLYALYLWERACW